MDTGKPIKELFGKIMTRLENPLVDATDEKLKFHNNYDIDIFYDVDLFFNVYLHQVITLTLVRMVNLETHDEILTQ